jgi:hypothetical protein
MNLETRTNASGAAISFIAASVIFVVLVVAVKFLVNAPAIDADGAAARTKALAEIRATEAKSLNSVGWTDESRGIVRLQIETAMQMTERNWQNPAAARADLVARAERAAAPAPQVATKPNPAE